VNKLGKLPARQDSRDITWKNLKAAGPPLPKLPPTFGYGTIFGDGEAPKDWQMNGNGPDDTVQPGFQGAGDCVFACAAHTTRTANWLANHPVTITGKESIADYSTVTGYVIGDDNTDNGTDMRTALAFRQKTGTLDAAGKRHKIGAYVALEAGDWTELGEACWIFSAVEIGFEFQQAQYDQFNSGVWDYDASSEIIGGHCVPFFGRHAGKGGGLVSWADHLWGTEAFYENLCDEAYAIVYPEELETGKTRHGYDLTALQGFLKEL
jgi:hypothetical protein